MNIDAIQNGYVIDHIEEGKGMKLYHFLGLDHLSCPVAMIRNVQSKKTGRKDIIKIDALLELDLDLIALITPNATVNVIRDGSLIEKKTLSLPSRVTDVLRCKNPRCIVSVEQELPHIFVLTDKDKRMYRCLYCESQAENA